MQKPISKMKNILFELERIESNFASLEENNAHRKRHYKEDLEWWILGRTKKIFDREQIAFPSFAEKLKEDDTDFTLSYNGTEAYKHIQITEFVLDEVKNSPSEKPDIDKLFKRLLDKKLSYNFGPNNWLLIYFDYRSPELCPYGYWHHRILQMVDSYDFSESTYEKILVIDAKGASAVSFHPYRFIISPEWMDQTTRIDGCLIKKSTYYKS